MNCKLLVALATTGLMTACSSLTYTRSVEPEPIPEGYLCDIKEMVTTSARGKTYELVNLISEKVANKEDCRAEQFTQKAYMRYIFVKKTNASAEFNSQLAFRRENGSFGALDTWIDLKEIYKDLEPELLVEYAESLPYDFSLVTETDAAEPAFWFKTRNSKRDSSRTWLQSYQDGYKRTEFSASGTQTEQCSADGQLWADC
jgi:hypothetical protein